MMEESRTAVHGVREPSKMGYVIQPPGRRPSLDLSVCDSSASSADVSGASRVISTAGSVGMVPHKVALPPEQVQTKRKQNFGQLFRSSLILLVPLLAGAGIPCLGAINSTMAARLTSTYWAVAFVIIGSAVICTASAAVAYRDPPIKSGVKNAADFVMSRWYHFLVLVPGLMGVEQNIIATRGTAVLGAGLANLCTLLGQIVGSSLIDIAGWAWSEKVGISLVTLLGAALVLVGCILYQMNGFIFGFSPGDGAGTSETIIWAVLNIGRGVSICFQSAVLQKLGSLLGRTRRATVWAYITGSVAAVIAATISQPKPDFSGFRARDLWTLASVPLNVWTLWACAYPARVMSFAKAFALIIIGQLVASTLIDGVGLFGVQLKEITYWSYIGICVVTAGVILVAYGRKQFLHQREKELATAVRIATHEMP